LSQELNFRVPGIRQPAHFFQHRCAGAAALRPAREGHHAVRTGFVAAFDNRQVGAKRIIPAGDFRFKSRVGVLIEAHHAAISGFQLGDQIRQLAVAGRTADQPHPGRTLEDLFSLLLGDAAEDADDFFLAGIFSVGTEPRVNFLGGFFADAAGVVEHQSGRVDRFDLLVSAPDENACDLLGIVRVHLAAERFEVEGLSRACGFGGHTWRGELSARKTCQGIELNVHAVRHANPGPSYHRDFRRSRRPARSGNARSPTQRAQSSERNAEAPHQTGSPNSISSCTDWVSPCPRCWRFSRRVSSSATDEAQHIVLRCVMLTGVNQELPCRLSFEITLSVC